MVLIAEINHAVLQHEVDLVWFDISGLTWVSSTRSSGSKSSWSSSSSSIVFETLLAIHTNNSSIPLPSFRDNLDSIYKPNNTLADVEKCFEWGLKFLLKNSSDFWWVTCPCDWSNKSVLFRTRANGNFDSEQSVCFWNSDRKSRIFSIVWIQSYYSYNGVATRCLPADECCRKQEHSNLLLCKRLFRDFEIFHRLQYPISVKWRICYPRIFLQIKQSNTLVHFVEWYLWPWNQLQ